MNKKDKTKLKVLAKCLIESSLLLNPVLIIVETLNEPLQKTKQL